MQIKTQQYEIGHVWINSEEEKKLTQRGQKSHRENLHTISDLSTDTDNLML